MRKNLQIAIDGPAGSGKSTLAKSLAESLSLVYLDTGAMYRAATLYFLRKKISPVEEKVLEALPNINIHFKNICGEQHIFLNDEDVSQAIRSPEITNKVSAFAQIGALRKYLGEKQMALGEASGVVMDGRDIGSVILPHADFKFYLTASPEARAKRRYEEFLEKKTDAADVSYQKVLEDIKARDHTDKTRAESPLIKADDAIEIDTDHLSAEEVLDKILNIIRNLK